ncbi:hypothetical protein B0H13DRAFT_2521648 [Mycena leptocephala]|nr:hypothetical protein B0H13DRAFT_2521648 [Mycena leptocephala]
MFGDCEQRGSCNGSGYGYGECRLEVRTTVSDAVPLAIFARAADAVSSAIVLRRARKLIGPPIVKAAVLAGPLYGLSRILRTLAIATFSIDGLIIGRPLFGWAAFAANLANQPVDYLTENSFFVSIKRCQNRKGTSSKAAYEVTDSGMRSNTHVEQFLCQIFPVEDVRTFKSLAASPDTLRCVVVCEMACCYMSNCVAMKLDDLFLRGTAARIADRSSSSARRVASALNIVCEKQFGTCIKAGDIERWIEAFEELK